MFEDTIRVPPENMKEDVKEAVKKSLEELYENKIMEDLGVILAITNVVEVGEGNLEVEDPGVYYPIKFEALVYHPKLHEVVEGEVVDITDFGVFVRFGPIDGLCHISQIINDYINYDKKSGILSGKESKKTLKIGDKVRGRIIGISLEKKEVNKINLTMRQPGLGSLDWLEQEKEKKMKVPKKKEEKIEKVPKKEEVKEKKG
jgi:DNA-directed RNA polymerase subunit E'